MFPFAPTSRAPSSSAKTPGPTARVFARRYHLHTPGIVYTGITILLVLGAINGQNNLLFWAFGLAVSGMVISGLLSGAALMGIRIRRDIIGQGVAGQPMRIRYTLSNRNFLIPCFALTIEELPDAGRSRHKAFWPDLAPRPIAFVAHVGPRRTEVCEASFTPWTRGRATFDAVRVSTTFPFGLTLKSVIFVQESETVIHPWRVPLLGGAFRSILSLAGDGRKDRPRAGEVGEFYALRDYQPRQSSRLIAWRPSARLDRAVVKESSQHEPGRLWIAVEGLEHDQPDGERLVSLAASIAAKACDSGLEVGLFARDGGVYEPPRRGELHLRRLLDALAVLDKHQPASELISARLPSPRRDSILRIAAIAASRDSDREQTTIGPDTTGIAASGAWASAPQRPESEAQNEKRFSRALLDWAKGLLP